MNEITRENFEDHITLLLEEIDRIGDGPQWDETRALHAELIGNILWHFQDDRAPEWFAKAIAWASADASKAGNSWRAFLHWKAGDAVGLRLHCDAIISESRRRIKDPVGVERSRRRITRAYMEMTTAMLLPERFDEARATANEALRLGIEMSSPGNVRIMGLIAEACLARDSALMAQHSPCYATAFLNGRAAYHRMFTTANATHSSWSAHFPTEDPCTHRAMKASARMP